MLTLPGVSVVLGEMALEGHRTLPKRLPGRNGAPGPIHGARHGHGVSAAYAFSCQAIPGELVISESGVDDELFAPADAAVRGRAGAV